MGYKKFVYSFTLGLAFLFMVIVGFNYFVDPLQFYRKSNFPKPYFSKEQRYQVPGLAKNYTYDTAIVGTSMAENFVLSYVNEKLGVKSINLAMSGATAYEQNLVAKMAIESNHPNNIIWLIDFSSFRGDIKRVRDDYSPFPKHFYDHNPFNDIRYLFNKDTLNISFNLLKSNLNSRQSKGGPNIDSLYNWNSLVKYGKKPVLKSFNEIIKGTTPAAQAYDPELYDINQIKISIDENIVKVVQSAPNTNFIFCFPPYSILNHKLYYDKSKDFFENELEFKRYFANKLANQKNVKIYDFQQEEKITFNLNNYKDPSHYSQKINEFIIDSIYEEKYILNEGNLERNLEKLRKQVENLKVKELLN